MSNCKIVAELGINHNGNMELVRRLICCANSSGCDFVKFQKRNIDLVYTKEELDKPRESPWGTTNREQKLGLELSYEDYFAIDDMIANDNDLSLDWFASPWDVDSVDFMKEIEVPYIKIASACITDMKLLTAIKETNIPVIISTGMSTREEFLEAWHLLGNQIEYILACTSTYPTAPEEMNLNFIKTLKKEFPLHRIGFSNHSTGIAFMCAAVAMGAEMIEFHFTLDRAMYGSDQAASIEPGGSDRLVKYVRNIEKGMGDGGWHVFDSEIPIREKLRKR